MTFFGVHDNFNRAFWMKKKNKSKNFQILVLSYRNNLATNRQRKYVLTTCIQNKRNLGICLSRKFLLHENPSQIRDVQFRKWLREIRDKRKIGNCSFHSFTCFNLGFDCISRQNYRSILLKISIFDQNFVFD